MEETLRKNSNAVYLFKHHKCTDSQNDRKLTELLKKIRTRVCGPLRTIHSFGNFLQLVPIRRCSIETLSPLLFILAYLFCVRYKITWVMSRYALVFVKWTTFQTILTMTVLKKNVVERYSKFTKGNYCPYWLL